MSKTVARRETPLSTLYKIVARRCLACPVSAPLRESSPRGSGLTGTVLPGVLTACVVLAGGSFSGTPAVRSGQAARVVLLHRLPEKVATAAAEFVYGSLSEKPRRALSRRLSPTLTACTVSGYPDFRGTSVAARLSIRLR